MEVLAEVMADAVLGGVFVRRLHPAVAAVDAPEVDRNALAEMAEHDLQVREFVEQAAADQPQRMDGGLGVERPSSGQAANCALRSWRVQPGSGLRGCK